MKQKISTICCLAVAVIATAYITPVAAQAGSAVIVQPLPPPHNPPHSATPPIVTNPVGAPPGTPPFGPPAAKPH